ncbi:DUF6036 family nucleotidyltransferase [Ktedonobacter racemifer]|uniref:DUF6036 domain-containing protein n=1 Tax=Ktedonobacter racemifer DSM 44963 TaxID=485913 RepID=D6TVZ8_KTERA|nr:DUF6036 family nucleotidyltransferase [Ktedonobacter racemifer]EFH84381.1 hypothetical protein Krac_5412 [Ktedonobacter racemifer DSM 44963]
MEGSEIEHYLQALDEELEKRTKVRKPVRLAVVGGVYMMFFVQNRASTKDIDVVPLDFPDTMNPNQETKAFRSAINAVAKRYQLTRDWMNDIVASFTPEMGPITLWRSYTNLQIYVPKAEYILALKLLAGRARDEDDIEALCEQIGVETRAQAQTLVDRYATPEWQKECNLQATFDDLFE